jgi:hypothetical protein
MVARLTDFPGSIRLPGLVDSWCEADVRGRVIYSYPEGEAGDWPDAGYGH